LADEATSLAYEREYRYRCGFGALLPGRISARCMLRGDGTAVRPPLRLAPFLLGALSQLAPLLGHLQQHRLFADVVLGTRKPQAFSGVAAILPRSTHTEIPPRSQGNAGGAELVPAALADLIRNFGQKFLVPTIGIWAMKEMTTKDIGDNDG
jgi:hypothetical protein